MAGPLIRRFDHAVIAVRDLEAASRRYRALGFEVRPGGRHVGLGTHNAIVRFGADYLELLGVYDRELALAGGERRNQLVEFLDRGGGPIGFALAVSGLDALADRLRDNRVEMEGPFAMGRERPDGRMLSWRLVVPWGSAWRRPWPFFIEWDVPDEERLSWDPPSLHPNGAVGIRAVEVVTDDRKDSLRAYQRLGMEPVDGPGSTFRIGETSIELASPKGSRLRELFRRFGAGLSRVVVSVEEPARVRDLLVEGGFSFEAQAGRIAVTDEGIASIVFEERRDA